MIKIRQNEKDIHKIFGFDTYENFVDAIALDNNDGKRLKGLLTIFLTVIDTSSPQVTVMSYMLKILIESLLNEKIESPSHMLKHLNGRLNAQQFDYIYSEVMNARKIAGLSSDISLKDLLRKDD